MNFGLNAIFSTAYFCRLSLSAMTEYNKTYKTLYNIYNKHRRNYRENAGDSGQMCLMWSTDYPPDIIEGTEPFEDIEEAFNIVITDDDAYDLYDMKLAEATRRIIEIRQK